MKRGRRIYQEKFLGMPMYCVGLVSELQDMPEPRTDTLETNSVKCGSEPLNPCKCKTVCLSAPPIIVGTMFSDVQ